MSHQRAILRTLGSLWFGAVLLMLLLVAMAVATVFESTHGTEHALAIFYKSWWFKALLGLVGLNVLAAMLARYPFSKRQAGFVITHTSLLLILVGAWVTQEYGVDGQLGLAEGQTAQEFRIRKDSLTLVGRLDQASASVDLNQNVFSGFAAAEKPSAPTLAMNGISVSIERYVPDSDEVERMVNDNPHPRPAVEVSLSADGNDEPVWLLPDQKGMLGPIAATFRPVGDSEELRGIVSPERTPLNSLGVIKVGFEGGSAEFPLEQCLNQTVAVRDTGYSIRVLRYLPHATVGSDRQIQNVSDQPVNPAVELEIQSPEGVRKQLAFAKFPDFQSMHGGAAGGNLKVTFVTTADLKPAAPIEVLAGPAGELLVRFSHQGEPVIHPLTIGTPVESPWPGLKFAVLRRFENARTDRAVEPVQPVRKERTPAILAKLATADHENRMWIQKDRQYPVTIDGRPYTLTFGDRIVPLGFALRLEKFHIGTYPGLSRPRSFESHVAIEDAASGRTQSRVISMNHPTKHGGYTFYQSSYRQEAGHSLSFLSVARDPGQPIVFTGYIGLMGGMVTVLGIRIRDRRRMARLTALAAAQEILGDRHAPSAAQLPHHGNGHSRRRRQVPASRFPQVQPKS